MRREHRIFKPLLQEGRNRPYLAVEATVAMHMLATVGYQGTVMVVPEDREKLTKVFVFTRSPRKSVHHRSGL